MDALIGSTGFVGGTLLRQRSFDRCFDSKSIGSIRNMRYGTVVCAGAPAAKWIADRDPDRDIANLQALAEHLSAVKAEHFVLVSTVDVFGDSAGKDEGSDIGDDGLTPYGRNRLWLESFVRERFQSVLIVRLPGLVGPWLRKNPIFDLRNGNNLHLIDARAVYQFYPMVNLWADLQTARAAGLALVHLTGEPLSIADIAAYGFGMTFDNTVEGRKPATYDLQTKHAAVFGGRGRYTYTSRESLLAIRAFAQSEPAAKPIA